MGGIFFFVVGPSGAGKDTLIDGARRVLSQSGRYVFARRVITRPSGSPGEDHDAMSEAAFAEAKSKERFLATWTAHDLNYGLDSKLLEDLRAGRHVVANGSRMAIAQLKLRVSRLVIVNVTAPAGLLAQRIADRGRESGEAIATRLSRKVEPIPEGAGIVSVVNDGSVELGIERFVAALEDMAGRLILRRLPIRTGRDFMAYLPARSSTVAAADFLGPGKIELSDGTAAVRARVHLLDCPAMLGDDEVGLSIEAFAELGLEEGTPVTLRRTPSPASRQALTAKIRGEELDEPHYDQLLRDIVASRYPDSEVAAFLVAASQHLSDAEVVSLARVRARFSEPIRWNEPIIVDKHSMGGIPGSRITLILVPIVAAHGLAMPKTSSRAITSAAGTADAMESVARVDLTPEDVRRCVAEARACIAWNGRLNHSVVDDVMNAITRPLGIDSNRWSVASILSKKLTAGSTHVVVDLPYGPRAKLHDRAQADDLAALFETVGAGLGLRVKAFATNGSEPIGRGIGPALEVRDVMWVLSGAPEAPDDLRRKALFFAGQILAFDPAIGSEEAGYSRAQSLLRSGAALAAFERIVDAQGRQRPAAGPGRLTHSVRADRSGLLSEIDGWIIADIARRAGAPFDKGAGIDLLCRVGNQIAAGEPLYTIYANAASDLESAIAASKRLAGCLIL